MGTLLSQEGKKEERGEKVSFTKGRKKRQIPFCRRREGEKLGACLRSVGKREKKGKASFTSLKGKLEKRSYTFRRKERRPSLPNRRRIKKSTL